MIASSYFGRCIPGHWHAYSFIVKIAQFKYLWCQSSAARYFNISNRHRMWTQNLLRTMLKPASKIDIEWWNRQKSVWFLRYWITFWWNLCKNCSFCQFWGIFGGILGMFALNQLYRKSNLKEQISNRT